MQTHLIGAALDGASSQPTAEDRDGVAFSYARLQNRAIRDCQVFNPAAAYRSKEADVAV